MLLRIEFGLILGYTRMKNVLEFEFFSELIYQKNVLKNLLHNMIRDLIINTLAKRNILTRCKE